MDATVWWRRSTIQVEIQTESGHKYLQEHKKQIKNNDGKY